MVQAEVYAHTPNDSGEWHGLEAHSKAVAARAASFGSKFGAEEECRTLGILHDAGKAHSAFQTYLINCAAGRRASSVPHSAPGAKAGYGSLQGLSLAVLGHHAGLTNLQEAKASLDLADSDAVSAAASFAACMGVDLSQPALSRTGWREERAEMFLRMCFSALVDADRLDTEEHFAPNLAELREGGDGLSAYSDALEARIDALTIQSSSEQTQVSRVRAEIQTACKSAAESDRGAFRLTAPTGGGKTIASMRFALRHALYNGMDRVIVAIPYTSIIDQAADVYSGIFGEGKLLEHHSAYESEGDAESQEISEVKRRLATENWDRPVVVTTTVQLFESLLHNKPSKCRKLHNIARSVLVLDEVQTLPTALLLPILDVLAQLIEDYGCSVMFCTATQPDYSGLAGTLLSEAKEIVERPQRHYDALRRVEFEVWDDQKSHEEVVEFVDRQHQVLCVLNSRPDAVRIARTCRPGDDLFHLSTLMCSSHRKKKLAEITRRLQAGAPVRLISTQVVEAGVDLDFPIVMRDLGPLDRIIQAAGRCNREGLLPDIGKCVVFALADGRMPKGEYRTATELTRTLLKEDRGALENLVAIRRYFRDRFTYAGALAGKGKEIQEDRRRLAYRDVAEKFRLIDDQVAQVVAMNYHREGVEAILAKAGYVSPRTTYRDLAARSVSIPIHLLDRYRREGLITQHEAGPLLYEGPYDDLVGIGTGEEVSPADLIV